MHWYVALLCLALFCGRTECGLSSGPPEVKPCLMTTSILPLLLILKPHHTAFFRTACKTFQAPLNFLSLTIPYPGRFFTLHFLLTKIHKSEFHVSISHRQVVCMGRCYVMILGLWGWIWTDALDRLISRVVLTGFSVKLKTQNLRGVHPVEEKVCENDNSFC